MKCTQEISQQTDILSQVADIYEELQLPITGSSVRKETCFHLGFDLYLVLVM